MSDLNSQLESLLSSARAAREVGDVDASNAAMNALGQFVASQSHTNPNALYNLDSSRGNYALMSEAQNAWLADPRNAETIRSWYAPAKQASASNSRPRTRAKVNTHRSTTSTPVNAKEMTDQYIPAEGIDPNGWIPVSSMPTNLSPNEVDVSNLGYSSGTGRLAPVFQTEPLPSSTNLGFFNNLTNSNGGIVPLIDFVSNASSWSQPTSYPRTRSSFSYFNRSFTR